jgi:hypothetical protein
MDMGKGMGVGMGMELANNGTTRADNLTLSKWRLVQVGGEPRSPRANRPTEVKELSTAASRACDVDRHTVTVTGTRN